MDATTPGRAAARLTAHRLSRMALLALAVVAGCRTPDSAPADAASDGGVAPPEAPASGGTRTFAPVGDTQLADTLSAAGFLLARCAHRDGDIVVRQSTLLAGAPAPARDELDGLLAALDEAVARGARPGGPADDDDDDDDDTAVRRYDLAVLDRWIADVAIHDAHADDARVELRRADGALATVVRFRLPHLLTYLRARALDGLLDDMSRPRRALDRHYVAVTGFLDAPGLDEHTLGVLRGEVREYLLSARDPAVLVPALLAHVERFDDAEFITAFADDENLGLRLLALTQSALGGDESALREILTLAFEYHDETAMFFQAVRAIFRPDASTAFYSAHPVDDDGEGATAFLEALRESLPSAQHDASGVWSIPSL